ncbi:MAG: calcium-binding protein [Pseudomonadota bacterium]
MIGLLLLLGAAVGVAFIVDGDGDSDDVEFEEFPDSAQTLSTGPGDDAIDLGGGDDNLSAGAGDDTILGGPGRDLILGGDGEDDLNGEQWNDVLLGGDGDDTLTGEAGADLILGEDGDDIIDAGTWGDVALGGDGADQISGGIGSDFLHGGLVTDNDLPFETLIEAVDIGRSGGDGEVGEELTVTAFHDDDVDVLNGGPGGDELFLGAGDIGTGGSEGDVFDVFYDFQLDDQEPAVITDFNPAEDRIDISHIDPDDNPVIQLEDDGEDTLIRANGVVIVRVEGVRSDQIELDGTTSFVTLN